jgi:hypothetical protein
MDNHWFSSRTPVGALRQLCVLKRIDVAGGEATTLCELEFPLGMSWTGDDIVQRSKRLDLRSVRHERDTPTHIRGTAARGHACLKQLLAH